MVPGQKSRKFWSPNRSHVNFDLVNPLLVHKLFGSPKVSLAADFKDLKHGLVRTRFSSWTVLKNHAPFHEKIILLFARRGGVTAPETFPSPQFSYLQQGGPTQLPLKRLPSSKSSFTIRGELTASKNAQLTIQVTSSGAWLILPLIALFRF